MSRPQVSVIIPTLDAEATIGAALDSVLEGQVLDVEVLVVDDGSQDGTRDAIERRRDPRIRWLTTGSRRSGSGVARNVAFEVARGDWVALLDADDIWAPGRLERLLDAAHPTGHRIVCDDVAIVAADAPDREDGATLFDIRMRGDRPSTWTLQLAQFVRWDLGLMMPVFERALLVEDGIRYPGYKCSTPDFSLLFDLIAREGGTLIVDVPSYVYRKQPGSESQARPEFWLDSLRMTADILRRETAQHPRIRALLIRRLHRSLARYHYLLAREHVRRRAYLKAALALLRSPRATALAIRAALRRTRHPQG